MTFPNLETYLLFVYQDSSLNQRQLLGYLYGSFICILLCKSNTQFSYEFQNVLLAVFLLMITHVKWSENV